MEAPMPEQQDTFDRPFCQTAIPRGRSRAFFVRILSVDRPLYLSLGLGAEVVGMVRWLGR